MEGICKIKEIDDEEWVLFTREFNEELTPDIIQFLSKYQRVCFGDKYNQSVENLPDCITDLVFGNDFNQPITYQTESSQNGKSPTLLPQSLTRLEFCLGCEFNQPLTYQTESSQNGKSPTLLPSGLTQLIFGENSKFNQPVNISDEDSPTGKSSILPDSLTDLEFGWLFDQPVDNLPNSLTYLSFGHNFNQPVTYQTESSQNGKSPTLLPESLTELAFGKSFNQPIDNLPNSLTHLTFEYRFCKSLKNLPKTLTHLYINGDFYIDKYEDNSIYDLPKSITHLSVNGNFNYIPTSVTHLTVEMGIHPSQIKYLPDSIEEISLPMLNIMDIRDDIPKKIKINHLLN